MGALGMRYDYAVKPDAVFYNVKVFMRGWLGYYRASLNIRRAEACEKIFRQSKQKSARIVDPIRRIFVTNDGKDSVKISCDEFLEVPYRIAEMKKNMERWNEWLRRRIRMYIRKQWKLPRTRVANLKKLGMPDWKTDQTIFYALTASAISSSTLARIASIMSEERAQRENLISCPNTASISAMTRSLP